MSGFPVGVRHGAGTLLRVARHGLPASTRTPRSERRGLAKKSCKRPLFCFRGLLVRVAVCSGFRDPRARRLTGHRGRCRRSSSRCGRPRIPCCLEHRFCSASLIPALVSAPNGRQPTLETEAEQGPGPGVSGSSGPPLPVGSTRVSRVSTSTGPSAWGRPRWCGGP
jgi:hypothetical protein